MALLYGVAATLVKENWVDLEYIENHTENFDDFKVFLEDWSAERGAQEAGVSLEEIRGLAHQIHHGGRVSFWWTMGVNQSYQGVRTAQAIINLALMSGNIGKPGTGANSITGQTNAMGSRLFSNTTGLLGGRDFKIDSHRQEVGEILDIPVENIPNAPSMDYASILNAVEEGRIKALWVIATNPAHSWINRSRFDRLVKKLDFLVVQDMYHSTETASMADLYLPAAGWGEKEGTVINSERRIGLYKKISKAPGLALSDFNIFRLLAYEWGCLDSLKAFKSPEETFKSLQKLSQGRPCDFSGIRDYRHIDTEGGIQWPYRGTEDDTAKERRLFEDGKFYRPSQKALFCFEAPRALPEPTNETYPFALLTGRGSASQWHTETRTSKSPILKKLYPSETWVEMNPSDAKERDIEEGDWLTIASARGSMKARAKVIHGTQSGCLFIGMHDKTTNLLTHDAFDPYSRQPNYKHCAVRIDQCH
jgi:assimilatory nitrate reductase catalytic subunit